MATPVPPNVAHDKPPSSHSGSLKGHPHDEQSPVGEVPYEKVDDDVNFGTAGTKDTHLVQQSGINRVEAFNRVFSRTSPVAFALYISLTLTSMAYVFDQSSTFKYDTFATSYFNASAYIGTISTVQSVVTAVSKPFLAKLADTFSRQVAYSVTLVFYVVGYIIVAASQTGAALCVGRVICGTGQAGLSLITQIIIADLTPLEWRGVATALTDFCYLFLPYVASTMVGSLCPASGTPGYNPGCFRWGFGMFCIITPVLVLPVILTLSYADHKAAQAGELGLGRSKFDADLAATADGRKPTIGDRFKQFYHLLVTIDAFGLILLGFGFSLIFLPFSLNGKADGGWDNPSMIAMIVVGFVILLLFVAWELWGASEPMCNRRIWGNKTFLLCVVIDVFYMCSGFIRSEYWDNWIFVIRPWNTSTWSYFTQTETVGLTLFGILAGLALRYTHRYKAIQLFGLGVRIIGMGITVWANFSHSNTTALVFTQILIALGGACSVVGTRVASQASVPHQDLAMVTANLALWSKLGSSMGGAIASAIYTGRYPKNLAKVGLSPKVQKDAYSSYTKAHAIPWGSEDRNKVIYAFDAAQRPAFIAALGLSFIPFLCGLYMPNYFLGKTQNAVDGTRNDGVVIDTPQADHKGDMRRDTQDAKPTSYLKRIWHGI